MIESGISKLYICEQKYDFWWLTLIRFFTTGNDCEGARPRRLLFTFEVIKQVLTESYNRGDVIVRPKNNNVISSTIHFRKETAWELSSGYQESYDINDQLYYLLDTLESKVSELNKIKD